jgi:hypothetical protein
MSILSFFVFALFVMAIGTIAVAFMLLINKNLRQGLTIRERLAQRVDSLRMSKMLAALGINFDQYLHQVPLVKINESMNKCDNCETIGQCDDALKQPVIKPDQIDFCPNQVCLTRFSELQSRKSTVS